MAVIEVADRPMDQGGLKAGAAQPYWQAA